LGIHYPPILYRLGSDNAPWFWTWFGNGGQVVRTKEVVYQCNGGCSNWYDGNGLRDSCPGTYPYPYRRFEQLFNGFRNPDHASGNRKIEKYRSTDISGNYADMARAFGGYGERVTRPEEIIPAIKRAIQKTEEGIPTLLEFITAKEIAVSIEQYKRQNK